MTNNLFGRPLALAAALLAGLHASHARPDDFLDDYAATGGFRLGHPVGMTPAPGGEVVYFLRSGPRSVTQDLYAWDVSSKKERLVLSAANLLGETTEKLSPEELARRERMRQSSRGVASFSLSQDGKRILVPLSGKLFVWDVAIGATKEVGRASDGFPIDPRFSPDGRFIACVRGGDLRVIDVESGQERALTHGASESLVRATAEFVAQEEMDRSRGYWWSPDSKFLCYQESDLSQVERLRIADPLHPEQEPSAFRYPRAGTPNAVVRLGVIAAEGGATRWIDWDNKTYPYLAQVVWSEKAPLTLLVQNREQTEERLLAADPVSGKTTTLLVEKDDAWINLDPSVPAWLPDGSGFLWSSERTGQWTLELRARDGRLVREIAPGSHGYRSFVGFHSNDRAVWIIAGSNPTTSDLYRVALDGAAGPRRLTDNDGVRSATAAKDGSLLVIGSAFLREDPRVIVFRTMGEAIESVGAIPSKALSPQVPHVELTRAGENPAFHAAIVRPRDFTPGRKYPTLVSVYGGPRAQVVLHARRTFLLQQWLADHGFIVVSLDGRGTPNRGRAWERAIKGNLIETPLADQAAGLEALAAKYPEIDRDRVGIYGWSFGGYFAAMAVARRPDVYRAAVAGAPVADWRDYDTHYTERYLGLPDANPAGYSGGAFATYAKNLTRPLLIIHGTADDNVFFLHALKMSDALLRANKPFAFLPLPGLTHMVTRPDAVRAVNQRTLAFFRQHLLTP